MRPRAISRSPYDYDLGVLWRSEPPDFSSCEPEVRRNCLREGSDFSRAAAAVPTRAASAAEVGLGMQSHLRMLIVSIFALPLLTAPLFAQRSRAPMRFSSSTNFGSGHRSRFPGSFFVGGPIPGLMAIALGPITTPTVAVTALLGNRSFDCRCFSAFLAGNIDCCRRIVICAAIGYGGVRIQG